MPLQPMWQGFTNATCKDMGGLLIPGVCPYSILSTQGVGCMWPSAMPKLDSPSPLLHLPSHFPVLNVGFLSSVPAGIKKQH